MTDYNKTTHSVFSINYHIVLVTKYRRKVISEPIFNRIKEIIIDTGEVWNYELVEINYEEDHLHFMISTTANINMQKYINSIKNVTSRFIRREYKEELEDKLWRKSFWKIGYFISTCGGVTIDQIKKYVQEQTSK